MSRTDKHSGSDFSDTDDYKPMLDDSETSDYDDEVMKTPSKKRAKKATESPPKKEKKSPKKGRSPGQKAAGWTAEEELMLIREGLGDTLPSLTQASVTRLSEKLGRTPMAIRLHWNGKMRQKFYGAAKAD